MLLRTTSDVGMMMCGWITSPVDSASTSMRTAALAHVLERLSYGGQRRAKECGSLHINRIRPRIKSSGIRNPSCLAAS